MSNITLYHFEGCPACSHAKHWMKELRTEKPELKSVLVEMVDVHKTRHFNAPESFTYVPTFFVDGKKVLEGAVSKEEIEQVLRQGLSA